MFFDDVIVERDFEGARTDGRKSKNNCRTRNSFKSLETRMDRRNGQTQIQELRRVKKDMKHVKISANESIPLPLFLPPRRQGGTRDTHDANFQKMRNTFVNEPIPIPFKAEVAGTDARVDANSGIKRN